MKTYKYNVTWKDGAESILEIEAESVLDGHYRIYRTYKGLYCSAYHIRRTK